MTERAFYSLIQFVPDQGRAEGANVGAVLVCPAMKAVRVLMAPNNEAPTVRRVVVRR